MNDLRCIQSLGFAAEHRGFGCSPSAVGYYLGYRCQVEQQLIAGESAPLLPFMRFQILLKNPNHLRLMVNPRGAGPPTPRDYGESVTLNGEGTKWASVGIAMKAICQALPMRAHSLYRLELGRESLDGYSDWLPEDTGTYGLCLECLVDLARRIDWANAMGSRAAERALVRSLQTPDLADQGGLT